MKSLHKRIVSVFLILVFIVLMSVVSVVSTSAQQDEKYKLGDVDLDGKITIIDATYIKFHLAKHSLLTEKQLELSDVDSNGEVTIVDATNIQLLLASIIDEFPNPFKDVLEDYWLSHLDEKSKQINNVIDNVSDNSASFFFYSDSHYNYSSKKSPYILDYLYKHTDINKTNFGGDIVNDEFDVSTPEGANKMQYLFEWREKLKNVVNHHSVVGNHDDGNVTDKLFTDEFIYSYLFEAEQSEDIVKGDGFYYYIDNADECTRYLYLDTAHKGVDFAQETFIRQALLTTPDYWHIVVISHAWFDLDYNQYHLRPVPVTGMSAPAQKVTDMLDLYNIRQGEFKDCKGFVEFCIGGHIHYDYNNTTASGIPVICVETDSYHVRGSEKATQGTITEACVSAVVADYDARTIKIIRVGRGEDITINISQKPITFTNRLNTALASDGKSIYNEIGYKPDTRWSVSSECEAFENGLYLTGYIPVKIGDIVRIKNITMNQNSDKGCLVFFYNSIDDTQCYTINNETLSQFNNAVWDSDENLVQFRIDGHISYIRLQATNINENSIITINELVS